MPFFLLPFTSSFSFLSPWISQIPCTLSLVVKFLTPCLPPVNTWTPLFTFNSRFLACKQTSAPSCRFLLTFTHTHPWEMWIFSWQVPREAKPLEIISRALPKKCVGIVWMGRGRDFLIVFLFSFFSSPGISQWKKKNLWLFLYLHYSEWGFKLWVAVTAYIGASRASYSNATLALMFWKLSPCDTNYAY